MYFANTGVVQWLSENDPQFLRAVVTHNEKTQTCR